MILHIYIYINTHTYVHIYIDILIYIYINTHTHTGSSLGQCGARPADEAGLPTGMNLDSQARSKNRLKRPRKNNVYIILYG